MHTQEEKAPRATHLSLCRLCATLALIVLFPLSLRAQTSLASNAVIHRTFQIKWESSTEISTGTAFAIDHASKQYLVTARHVVKRIKSGNVVKIHHEREWKDYPVNVVGIGKKEEIDIAVLAGSVQLAPPIPLVASDKGLTLGQQVSFLGFPFGWHGGGEQINRGFPLPLVKAGIVSMLNSIDMPYTYLDGHSNSGFSGGPVVFSPTGQPGDPLHVAGVLSGYPKPNRPELRSAWQPLVDDKGRPFASPDGEKIAYVIENPGIVAVIPIHHVVELIDANPIGFPLSVEQQEETHGRKVLQK